MSNIVGVQFQSKFNPNEFSGREYNYLTAIELSEGDIVVVPTKNGDGIAKVVSIDVPDSKIDERIMPLLKTIERLHMPETNNESEELLCQ